MILVSTYTACFGDAGGPLYDNVEPKFLIGVVTGATGGCADNKVPDVYADVAAFNDWIEAEMDDATCDRECVGCFCEAYGFMQRFGTRVSHSIENFFNT